MAQEVGGPFFFPPTFGSMAMFWGAELAKLSKNGDIILFPLVSRHVKVKKFGSPWAWLYSGYGWESSGVEQKVKVSSKSLLYTWVFLLLTGTKKRGEGQSLYKINVLLT